MLDNIMGDQEVVSTNCISKYYGLLFNEVEGIQGTGSQIIITQVT